MTHHKLPTAAESIRKSIKELIPETATSPSHLVEDQGSISHETKNGNKTYRGELLAEKVSLLTEQLRIAGNLQIGRDWRWHLVHFSEDTKLENARKSGYLVILSNNITLTPGGILEERFYTYITNEPVLSAGATVIFIVPPPLG
ncbi:hypothetical protein N7508_007156 [Penicillium antarcticum]|uniref:uncharacterized protein n=1 Tax=Penicillium antarcticum TaxID=416450 RepID=UPI002394DFE7|nr:uncharacterized protein N7508_007156 [Penicillium antarcticum]KAJ5302293.1 hypothetical protein N7508_007156 [Penicillium antarcticum]